MRKILTIAMREYRAMVATKAFLISIAVMPLLMFGGMIGALYIQKAGTAETKRVAIFDPSDQYYNAIVESARAQNQLAEDLEPNEKSDGKDDDLIKDAIRNAKVIFSFERIDQQELTDELRIQLSNRIRSGELYAFVEIPEGLSDLQSDSDNEGNPTTPQNARFYSEEASISNARGWLQNVISERTKSIRLGKLNVDEAKVQKASQPVPLSPTGLVSKDSQGNVSTKKSKNFFVALLMPIAVMMLMFMVIFLSAQPTLESVLEEKSQRIAEVLLGSANPFQLMAGKLIGTVAGSLTAFTIYFSGTLVFVFVKGWGQFIPYELAPWFVVFQVLGVMFYSSIFMAVGASVSQTKEAQAMLMPVWMVKMSPMFVWIFAVQEPNGKLATWFSFFPPVTPTMMLLRLSTGQSIPTWQPIVGVILLAICTVVGVFIAGRIFRIGILWQGKTPKISELLKWGLFG